MDIILLYIQLQERYKQMSRGHLNEKKINDMMEQIVLTHLLANTQDCLAPPVLQMKVI